MRFLSLTIVIALLLSSAGLAEELGEMDLYAPEISTEECAVEAPTAETTDATTTAETSEAAPASETTEAAPASDATDAVPPVVDALVVNEGEPTEPAVSAPQAVALTARKATAQMNVGEALQITVNAGEAGTFTSKSAKLATVDASGLVTALAKGTAKIEFKPEGGKKRTLRVKIADPYEPTGVSIRQGRSVTLNVGDALQLNAALAPETARTALTWKSGKAKVATVDADGVVTALGEGKAKITVATANKKKATIAVTVVNPYKPTGVSICQGKALTLKVGESVQLDAALAPETARTVLTWKSGKTKVATVDASGCVTAIAGGTAKITVTTDNRKSDALVLRVVDTVEPPRSPAMNDAAYNGTSFKVVNTAVDPMTCAKLMFDNVCTHPAGTDKYSGYCLCFCNYYVSCMVDNLTDADVSAAIRKYRTSKKLRYSTELYGDPDAMMARLYDLLSAGAPQMLMVEAITHPGRRHFVVVVGYRASVTRREELRPEDLLVIDSFDGRLESMDPALDPIDTRVLFKQKGKYRIDAVSYKS